MKKFLAIAVLLFPLQAFAVDDVYVGVGLGQSHGYGGVDLTGKALVGVKVKPNLAGELSYVDFGKLGATRSSALSLDAVYTSPPFGGTRDWNLIARAGLTMWDRDADGSVSSSGCAATPAHHTSPPPSPPPCVPVSSVVAAKTDWGTDLDLGAGVEYRFAHDWRARLEATTYRGIDVTTGTLTLIRQF